MGVRNLGIIFDPGLAMKPYVTEVSQAGYHELYTISYIRPYLRKKAAATAINAFFL